MITKDEIKIKLNETKNQLISHEEFLNYIGLNTFNITDEGIDYLIEIFEEFNQFFFPGKDLSFKDKPINTNLEYKAHNFDIFIKSLKEARMSKIKMSIPDKL